ncbi:MAG: N-acetylmuramoyl-L-alanine amidase [Bacteroidales bacterium]|nr:N-acetylmuramoyl-L-alanine amidase [Bacteroidales bacterium]
MRIITRIVAFAFFFSLVLPLAGADDHSLHIVVIDPGHGGKDPGAVSRDRKTYEKNIALSIAKKLGEKIKAGYSDSVKVFYTRETDVFIPLQQRADIANAKHADLFISVHIDACRSASVSGHSVHVLGESSNSDRDVVGGNLDVCKRENSVILLEDDYSTKYQGFDPEDEASYIFMTLMQSAFYEQSIYFASLAERELCRGPLRAERGVQQHAFYVLWKTSMPSVLLELGFITNDQDLALLRTEKGRDQIAERVYQAFRVYKKNYDDSMNVLSMNK